VKQTNTILYLMAFRNVLFCFQFQFIMLVLMMHNSTCIRLFETFSFFENSLVTLPFTVQYLQ